MGNPEKAIAEAVLAAGGLSAAKLGLRFDKVVVRVLGDLRAYVERQGPEGVAVVVTITAPIRVPGRTADAVRERIEALSAAGSPTGDWSGLVHDNRVSLRLVTDTVDGRPKLVGFVHNPDGQSKQFLDLAETWLRGWSEERLWRLPALNLTADADWPP